MMQRYHSLKIKLISITRLVGRGSLEIYLTKTNLIKNAELGEGLQTVCLFVPCSVYFLRLSDDRYMQT